MEFGELLKVFLIDLQALFRSRIGNGPLTLPQILLISSIPDDGIDMTSLAHRLGVDNSTATRLMDKVIRNGWATRRKSNRDKRIIKVELTETGEKLQNEIEDRVDQFGEEIVQSIPLEDRDEIKESLSSFHWRVSKLLLKDH